MNNFINKYEIGCWGVREADKMKFCAKEKGWIGAGPRQFQLAANPFPIDKCLPHPSSTSGGACGLLSSVAKGCAF
jgi:hypothetical protein